MYFGENYFYSLHAQANWLPCNKPNGPQKHVYHLRATALYVSLQPENIDWACLPQA